jgi:flavin reductase (DIM6/NTAB) family NADH-FMN oxidoreductase RutF
MTQKQYSASDIANMQHRYKAHFVNSLTGFKSANLIGSIDAKGVTNLCLVSSAINLGTEPALVGFVYRQHAHIVSNTLDNIIATDCFTLNHITAEHLDDAHHTSARYQGDVSEFDQTEFDAQYGTIAAPYVKQSRIKLGLQFKQKIDLPLNGLVMIIGQVKEVILDGGLLLEDGKIDLVAAQSLAVTGLDEYHTSASLGRRDYAKPRSFE